MDSYDEGGELASKVAQLCTQLLVQFCWQLSTPTVTIVPNGSLTYRCTVFENTSP